MNPAHRDIVVLGPINAGKSCLINALVDQQACQVGPVGGTTLEVAPIPWPSDPRIRLVDTPGLEQVGGEARARLATDAASRADLVLFVTAEDLTSTAQTAIASLRRDGKLVVVVFNKVDLLAPADASAILEAIRFRLRHLIAPADILPVAASPWLGRRTNADEAFEAEPALKALAERLGLGTTA